MPIRPLASGAREVRRHFVRGQVQPRGVVWFGIKSFWGHLRHFVASAIATEDIDSRDWMTPDDPRELAARVLDVLGGDTSRPTVLEGLGRDLWIDYVSDTGDDVSVSAAVAELVVSHYELPDPDREGEFLLAPRGEILLCGGDTAYPVATALEINNRVLVPFNRAIERRPHDKPRVLLGIPGNHDWYDGLDGFGRMFRRRDSDDEPRPSLFGVSQRMLEHYAEWAREFVRGGKVEKPKALVLSGYTPVQNASYFVLPLTPNIHLFASDRQLKTIDSRQRRFHTEWYQDHPQVMPWVLLPDPLYAFGSPSPTGTQMVQALQLDFEARPHFILSGDVHHYERLNYKHLLHVVAGGGGAFLHPAPLFEGRLRAEVRFPNSAQSRPLLRMVPFKVARGRSGFLPHLMLGALVGPEVAATGSFDPSLGMSWAAPLAVALLSATLFALIGGLRTHPARVLPIAFAAGILTGAVPLAVSAALGWLVELAAVTPPAWLMGTLTLLVTVYLGVFIFGAYLAILTRAGLEHTQAFTALDHPGFKHFLRLRVRADGQGIDGWCVGMVDPLREGETPVLVDHFTWRIPPS